MRITFFHVFVLASAPCALVAADQYQPGDLVRLYDREGNKGGELEAATVGTQSAMNWRTFSLGDPIGAGMRGADMAIESISHGFAGDGAALSAQTAYLFTQFSRQQLSGYDYSSDSRRHARTADELQEAIWYLEGKTSVVNGLAAGWVAEANAAVGVGGSWYEHYGNGLGGYDGLAYLGDVRVMNLRWADSQRGGFGDASTATLVLIPAPPAVLLGIIGLAAVRRRLRQSL